MIICLVSSYIWNGDMLVTCWWHAVTCVNKLQNTNIYPSTPIKTNFAKQDGQGSSSRTSETGIWYSNSNVFHLDAIMSVSLWSVWLYFPSNIMGLLLVAKKGIVLSLWISRSEQNWFFGRGRWTVWPSSSNKSNNISNVWKLSCFAFEAYEMQCHDFFYFCTCWIITKFRVLV